MKFHCGLCALLLGATLTVGADPTHPLQGVKPGDWVEFSQEQISGCIGMSDKIRLEVVDKSATSLTVRTRSAEMPSTNTIARIDLRQPFVLIQLLLPDTPSLHYSFRTLAQGSREVEKNFGEFGLQSPARVEWVEYEVQRRDREGGQYVDRKYTTKMYLAKGHPFGGIVGLQDPERGSFEFSKASR